MDGVNIPCQCLKINISSFVGVELGVETLDENRRERTFEAHVACQISPDSSVSSHVLAR